MTDYNLSRRKFLQATATAGGGLMLAFHLPALANAQINGSQEEGELINAWLLINADDTITLRVARAEMGQGVMTSMAMLVAEELEADWRLVSAEYADPNLVDVNRVYGSMATHGSNSVRDSQALLQQAGAHARQKLIGAAALRWGVDASRCHADYGQVHHKASGRAINYGAIAAEAAKVRVSEVGIKTPADFNLLGLPTTRLDGPAKVNGSATYSIDVRLPGMVYAAVVHCPVLGGTLRSYRFNAVRNRPGVRQAVRLDNGVAIVADSWWQAKTAIEALPVEWLPGDGAQSSSESITREFMLALDGAGTLVSESGEAMQAMEDAQTSIASDYLVPYLPHACPEPMNCTVHVTADKVEVWGGFQAPVAARRAVAEVTGKPLAQVQLHNCFLGGGFGRRTSVDVVREAALIALEVNQPVQMIWSREEDTRSGYYRPMAAIRFKAGFDMGRQLVAYTNHSVCHSIAADVDPEMSGVDASSLTGLVDMPYPVANKRITHTRNNTHLKSWYWRSVGASQNIFARECFVDEMAEAAGQDALAFRRGLLKGQDRYLQVLTLLAQKASWGQNMAAGSAQGLAIYEQAGSVCGQVADVSLSEQGTLRVERIVSVVDCGNLVNPLGAEAQIESGVIFGLSAALYGKLTVENGRVLEDNFDAQQFVSMADTPHMETHWALSAGNHWGGLGELGTPCVAPAVCNALYQITGRRIRSLPLQDYYLQRRRS